MMKIAIIGGGAAGMMRGNFGRKAYHGVQIFLVEKN
jgi:predicted flavoprotein YhiN